MFSSLSSLEQYLQQPQWLGKYLRTRSLTHTYTYENNLESWKWGLKIFDGTPTLTTHVGHPPTAKETQTGSTILNLHINGTWLSAHLTKKAPGKNEHATEKHDICTTREHGQMLYAHILCLSNLDLPLIIAW